MTLVIFFFMRPSCSSQEKRKEEDPMNKVELTVHLDMARPDGTLMVIEDTIVQYCTGRFYVYKYSYKEFVENGDSLLITNKPAYFVFEQHAKAGLTFTSLTGNNGTKQVADSFLTNRTYRGIELYNSRSDSLITGTPRGNGVFVQQYVPKVKHDITYPDTSYFYFDNTMQDVKYPLSRILDSTYKSKVYKIHILYNRQKLEGSMVEIPQRSYLFELRRAKTDDMQAITALIEKFESLQKKDMDLRPH